MRVSKDEDVNKIRLIKWNFQTKWKSIKFYGRMLFNIIFYDIELSARNLS